MLGARGMVGLIVPSNNNVVLPEFYSMLPAGVTAYETRMRVEGELTFEALRKMIEDAEDAAELLRQTGVDFICYCCMASTIVKGLEWERALLARFSDKAPKGVVSANSVLMDALRKPRQQSGSRCSLLIPRNSTSFCLNFLRRAVSTFKTIAGLQIKEVSAVRKLSPKRSTMPRAALCWMASTLVPARHRHADLPDYRAAGARSRITGGDQQSGHALGNPARAWCHGLDQ